MNEQPTDRSPGIAPAVARGKPTGDRPSIPGIHLATGRFNVQQTLERTPDSGNAGRRRQQAQLGDWLSAHVNSRYAADQIDASDESGTRVLFDGYLTEIVGMAAGGRSPAATILALYRESGLDFLARLRGSYTCVIIDAGNDRAHLFNDRRASRPLFYRQDADGSLLTGPEVAVLAQAAPALHEIDPVAVCEFLIFTSYYNDRTLFPAIRNLPPASVMSLGPDSTAVRRYWQIRIEPDKAPSVEEEWVEEAISLFNQSIKRLLAQGTRPFLYLSGGIDSRMILGSLRENGYRVPAVTYGTQEGDDAPLARQLAQHCGLPFTYFPISTENPQKHFLDAALRADCRAETIDTPSLGLLQDQLAESFDLFIQGDKSFLGNHARTPAESLIQAGVWSFEQARRLGDMLEPAVFANGRNSIEHTLHDMRSAGSGIDPQDLRDWVYYEHRLVNRQNAFASANLRRFEQARPWLDEDLVDFLFLVPGSLRTGKSIARKMLQTAHPDLAAIPFADKDSIPQARTYRQSIPANPALGEFVRAQFEERLDPRLAAMFRSGSLSALVDSLLAGTAYPIPHTRWWQALPGMWRFNAKRYHSDRVHPVSIVLRLMQLNLYLRSIKRDENAG